MNENKTYVERVFDFLSAIPKLKQIMTSLWIFSTVSLGLVLLLEASYFISGKLAFRIEWLWLVLKWILVNLFFALIFYYWNLHNKKIKK